MKELAATLHDESGAVIMVMNSNGGMWLYPPTPIYDRYAEGFNYSSLIIGIDFVKQRMTQENKLYEWAAAPNIQHDKVAWDIYGDSFTTPHVKPTGEQWDIWPPELGRVEVFYISGLLTDGRRTTSQR